jgi:adenylate cyclase
VRSAFELAWLRLKRLWLVILGTSLVGTAVGYVWWTFDVLEMSDDERASYDDGLKKFTGVSWFPWGEPKRNEDIVIVAIDDKTFREIGSTPGFRSEYGNWPYERSIYAHAFSYLNTCGAKQIVFDATIDEAKGDGVNDLALAETLRKENIPVYLGVNASVSGVDLPKVDAPTNRLSVPAAPKVEAAAGQEESFPEESFEEAKPEAEQKAKALELAAAALAFPVEVRGGLTLSALGSEDDVDEKGNATGKTLDKKLVPPIAPALESMAGFGLVVHEEDEDGKMRKTRFAYTDGVNSYVTLPVAAYADAVGADKVIIEPHWLTIGSKRIPIDADGTASIDYGGKLSKRFRAVPLVDLLVLRERKQGCELFKDKVIFLAGFALGTSDVKATPLEQSTPGVMKQVSIYANLLDGRFVTDAPFWVSLLLAFLVALFSASLVLVVRNVFVDIGWPVLLFVGFFLVTGSFLVVTKIHVLSAMPSFAGTIASILSTAWERLFAGKERERLKEMFSSYMDSGLVEKMVEQSRLPTLDGQETNVTAFFSDIRGFSSFSEKLRAEPRRLIQLLNRYLSTVTPLLTDQGACIDKYIGDAVVALFGAPVPHSDHPLRACKGALAVQKAVGELREALSKEGLPDVYTRIGLNTDTMMVGNIGSAQLLDYTAIGDGMNLAARLEAANKAYDTLILMGENTYQRVKNDVVAREVDAIRVAGKSMAVSVYELIGLRGEVDAPTLEVVALHQQGLRLMRERKFQEALDIVTKALQRNPGDGPSKVLAARCRQYIETPPSAAWDGSVDLEK